MDAIKKIAPHTIKGVLWPAEVLALLSSFATFYCFYMFYCSFLQITLYHKIFFIFLLSEHLCLFFHLRKKVGFQRWGATPPPPLRTRTLRLQVLFLRMQGLFRINCKHYYIKKQNKITDTWDGLGIQRNILQAPSVITGSLTLEGRGPYSPPSPNFNTAISRKVSPLTYPESSWLFLKRNDEDICKSSVSSIYLS